MNYAIEYGWNFQVAKAKQYVADVDEIRPQYVLDAPSANALFASDIVRSNGASIASTINQLDNAAVTDLTTSGAWPCPATATRCCRLTSPWPGPTSTVP